MLEMSKLQTFVKFDSGRKQFTKTKKKYYRKYQRLPKTIFEQSPSTNTWRLLVITGTVLHR